MYPLEYFAYQRPYPTTDLVFVAMSFDRRLEARWTDVLAPAISSVSFDGRKLVPYRVDTSRVSDSILAEIMKGVASSRIIVADITSLHELDGIAVRNPNVMYEVGLAHATRLAEEVLLFRSDSAKLLFDVAPVRVTSYDPDGRPEEARQLVAERLNDALQAVVQRKRQLVDSLVRCLDGMSWQILLSALNRGQVGHIATGQLKDIVAMLNHESAIRHLLQLGLIQLCDSTVTPDLIDGNASVTEMFKYEPTPLGREVVTSSFAHLGFLSVDTLKYLTEKYPEFKVQLRAILSDTTDLVESASKGTARACPMDGSLLVLHSAEPDGHSYYRCPQAGCDFKVAAPEPDPPNSVNQV